MVGQEACWHQVLLQILFVDEGSLFVFLLECRLQFQCGDCLVSLHFSAPMLTTLGNDGLQPESSLFLILNSREVEIDWLVGNNLKRHLWLLLTKGIVFSWLRKVVVSRNINTQERKEAVWRFLDNLYPNTLLSGRKEKSMQRCLLDWYLYASQVGMCDELHLPLVLWEVGSKQEHGPSKTQGRELHLS